MGKPCRTEEEIKERRDSIEGKGGKDGRRRHCVRRPASPVGGNPPSPPSSLSPLCQAGLRHHPVPMATAASLHWRMSKEKERREKKNVYPHSNSARQRGRRDETAAWRAREMRHS
ncbi:hypothetical protein MTO96_024227 [Rhipicephalus appendiculatus]